MNARPDYANLETGEIVDVLPDGGRTPLQIAKSELAAFKFKLVETVAADPKLAKAPCTDAIIVFMHFVTIDETSLQSTAAYASLITLMARGGMKRTAANKARKLLVANRYLVPTGSKTKEGSTKYRLENPRAEIVAMHIKEATEYWNGKAAETRKEERRKQSSDDAQHDVVSECDTTETARGVSRQHDVVSEYDTNYLGGNLGGLGSREEGQPIKVSTAPSNVDEDRDDLFPIPANEAEARQLIVRLLEGKRPLPVQMLALQHMLMKGTLRQRHIDDLEDAA